MHILSKCVYAIFLLLGSSVTFAQNAQPPASDGTANIPTQTPATNPAEGYYSGTLSNGNPISVIIVNNGRFWLTTRGSTELYAVIEGVGTASNGRFTSLAALAIGGDEPLPIGLSATYSPQIGIEGELEGPPSPASFSAAYNPLYDMPYPIATVSGNYSGRLQIQNEVRQISVTIDSSGRLNGNLTQGPSVQAVPQCSFSGAIQQRSPQKNPYYFEVSFNDSTTCGYGPDTLFSGAMSVAADSTQASNLSAVMVGSDDDVSKLFHMIVSKAGTPATPAPAAPATPAPVTPAPATPSPPSGGSIIDNGFLLR